MNSHGSVVRVHTAMVVYFTERRRYREAFFRKNRNNFYLVKFWNPIKKSDIILICKPNRHQNLKR